MSQSRQLAAILKILLLPLQLLFSCSTQQETAVDLRQDNSAPTRIHYLIDSRGDTIPTGKPVVVIEQQKRKIAADNPKILPISVSPDAVPAHNNIHPAGDSVVVPAPEEPTLIIPGQNGILLPDTLPAQTIVLPAFHTKPIVADPPRMRENAVANIQYLGVEEGLSDYYIFSILEDSRGNLWFGSSDGNLTRYDGRNMIVFQSPKALPQHAHTSLSLLEDQDGNIWFGTETGIGRYDGNWFTYYADADGSKYMGVTKLLQDNRGNIWFGTNAWGMVQFDGHHFIHYKTDNGIIDNSVRTILEDNKGNLWIGTGGGLNRFDGQSFIQYTTKEGMSDNNVKALFADSKGKLWISTQGGGLVSFDGYTFSHYLTNLSNNTVNAILEDSRGVLWFTSPGNTLNRFDGKTITQYYEENGTNSSNGNTLMEDSHGNLWFGTNEGLHKFGVFRFMNYNEELDFQDIATISEDSRGHVLFGTYGTNTNGLFTFDDNVFTHYSSKNVDFFKSGVNSIHEDSRNNLWLGTRGGDGLVHFDRSVATQYRMQDELTNIIFSSLTDSLGNIWLGTMDGLVYFDGSSFTAYATVSTAGSNKVHSLVQGNNGDIWFGHHQYLGRFDGTSFTYFTTAEGLPDNDINTLIKDSNGHLWIGTNEGLSHYDGQSFSNYTQQDGLINNRIYTLIEDLENNIWVGTQNGLSVLTPASIDGPSIEARSRGYKIFNFGKEDGLKQADFLNQSTLLDSKNRMWWGKTKGAMMLDLSQFKLSTTLPKIHLDHIEFAQQYVDLRKLSDPTYRQSFSFGEPLSHSFDSVAAFYDYPEELTLPHTLNHLTFNFSGSDWASPYALRYRYRLKGLDEDWSLPQAESKAEYRNLPYGNFTLQVMAIGSAQTWSEPFEYAFTILPPWWHTWWAYSGYGLVGICFVFILGRYQRHRLIEKEKQRVIVRELAQAKEIKKAYHDLKGTQSQLIQSEKMASLGELTAGIAHEIQNPLNFVNNFSEVNKELINELIEALDKNDSEEVRAIAKDILDNEDKVMHHGKRAEVIVKSMLQHSRTSSGEKEPTDINALADEYLRLAYHGLRAKDKSFNATMKTDFDPGIGKVNVIPQDIGRVILNLITNAFYAVTEQRKSQPDNYEPTVSVSTKKSDNKVLISVKDNGNGIPQKVLDKIFQPFFTTKPAGQGTGLGLSLSYDIVKAHGGELKVETKEAEGSQFFIQLPIL